MGGVGGQVAFSERLLCYSLPSLSARVTENHNSYLPSLCRVLLLASSAPLRTGCDAHSRWDGSGLALEK